MDREIEYEHNNGEQEPTQSMNSPYIVESSPPSPSQSTQMQISESSPPRTSRSSLSKTSRPSSSRKRRANDKPSSEEREEQQQQRSEPAKSRKKQLQILCEVPIVTPQSESQDETSILIKRIENLRTKIKYFNARIEDFETEETKTRTETTLALAQADKALAETSNARARADKARAEAKLAQAQADKARAEAEKAKAEGIVIHEKMQAQTIEAYIKTVYTLLPMVQKYMESLLQKSIEQQ